MRDALARDPGLQARHGKRPRRLHHRARVVEDVLDGRAHLVVGHPDDFLYRLLHDRERPLADFAHGHAVGENPDMFEPDPAAGGERLIHGVGFERLDADDLHLRPDRLDVAGDPADEAAAAHGHEDRRDAVLSVPQNLVADRALSRDHERIVEGMDERHPVLLHERVAVRLRVAITVADEHDLGAHVAHGVHLDLRRRLRHDDDGPQPELSRGIGDALRVIAGAGRDDAARALLGGEMRDAVVRAAQLEAEDRLLILALEQHVVAEPPRQTSRRFERRFARHVVHTAGQNVVKELGDHGFHSARTFEAFLKTSSIICSVSLPVFVFWRLGW